MAVKSLDLDVKRFIELELNDLKQNIDIDYRDYIPFTTEKFVEQVIKDDQGILVKNHLVHLEMHRFRRKAKRKGFNKMLILGAFGHGKCFMENEKINLENGKRKKVQNAKKGDIIFSVDLLNNKPMLIKLEKDAFFAGIQPCYEIIFGSGKIQRVSWNHPYSILGRRWIKAKDLKPGTSVRCCGYPLPTDIKNKTNLILGLDGYYYDFVKSILFIGDMPTYGIEVPITHIHVIDNLVSHNTEQMCLGVALHEIARNPNILIKIVHVSEENALDRVRAIKEYIEKDEDYKKLCPHVEQTSIWGQKKFIVKRKSISKDPTVQGFGILSTNIGGRASLEIFDDPQDYKSAVLEPSTREAIEAVFKNIWLTRLIPRNHEVLVLMNRWHQYDIANYITNTATWAWLSVEVAEDKNSLICKDSFGMVKHIPLWPEFPKEKLEEKHLELGDSDYNRGYRLIPFSDTDKTFPNFDNICHYGITPIKTIDDEKNYVFMGGIDFSGTKRPGTILVVVAMNIYTGQKFPVKITAYKKPSDLAEGMVAAWKEFGVEKFIAENNATQSAIIDLLETTLTVSKYKRLGIVIEGFHTGKNKADIITGLPGLQKEFEKKLWTFYFDHQFTNLDIDDRDIWCRCYREFIHHPFYTTSDIVMALWFAESGLKQYLRTDSGPSIF